MLWIIIIPMNFYEYFQNLKRQILTQTLPGTYKKPFSGKTCILFLILGIMNLAIGIFLCFHYSSLTSINLPYQIGTTTVPFTIKKTITKPLFLYLDIKNFYQSHFFYGKSVSIDQLLGKATTNINSCKPLKYSGDKIIYPCGLIANTYNQDLFTILKDKKEIIINVDNIAWKSLKEKIKKTSYTLDQIVAPPLWKPYTAVPQLENDHRFINWMAPASFPDFRKLYGKIDGGLLAGEYEMVVESSFLYGDKSIVLAESSWAGVKNHFLAVFMMVSGLILVVGGYLLYLKSDTFTQ